jgi:hypothetical protein
MENQNERTQAVEEQKKKKPSTGLKVAVLVILIAILAVGILLPIKLVPNAVSSVASSITSFFGGKKEPKVTVDKSQVNVGEQFTVAWDGKLQTDGTYALSYECSTGLHLETSINQPNETIACGTPFYFSPNQNSIDLIGFSDTARTVTVKLTLGFLENGASTLDTLGETSTTIINPNVTDTTSVATTTPSTNQPTPEETEDEETEVIPPSTNTPRVSNPNGTIDLEVRPIAVGYLNANGDFVASGFVGSNQQAAVRFSIVNVGDKNTGSWSFVAELPSQTDPRFTSATQQNLGPGDRIEYTLGFNNMTSAQNNTVVITADPSNQVPERTDANNVARMIINNTQVPGTVSTTGKADLIVRVLDTGVINRSTGAYTAQSSVTSSDKVGIRFEVENIGSVATGAWKFQATLPTNDTNNRNYESAFQNALNPGQKGSFTIGFENIQAQGGNTATIYVDSATQVDELNEVNNRTSVNIIRN